MKSLIALRTALDKAIDNARENRNDWLAELEEVSDGIGKIIKFAEQADRILDDALNNRLKTKKGGR